MVALFDTHELLQLMVDPQDLSGTLAKIRQGAMVLPVVTRGMMDRSATRRFSIP
jgi:hypothetical protein